MVSLTDRNVSLSVVSRRNFLVASGGALGALAFPSAARAVPLAAALPWLKLGGQAAYGAAVAWFVQRALDDFFAPPDASAELMLGLTPFKPAPSGDSFHDRFAEPSKITEPKAQLEARQSRDGHCKVEVDEYLRADSQDPVRCFKDLSRFELKRFAYHDQFTKATTGVGTLLFPCGPREPASAEDLEAFHATVPKYKLQSDSVKLDYVRPVNDGRRAWRGFGVTCHGLYGAKRDFLVELADGSESNEMPAEVAPRQSDTQPLNREAEIERFREQIRRDLQRQRDAG